MAVELIKPTIIDKYLSRSKMRRRPDATQQSTKHALGLFAKFIAKHRAYVSIDEIVYGDFDEFIERLIAEDRAANTINKYLGVIKDFFQFLYDTNALKSRHFKQIQKTVVTEENTPCPRIDAVKMLLNSMSTNSLRDIQFFLTVFVMANTGVRREELVKMKYSDFVTANRKARLVVIGKGKKRREIAISYSVYETVMLAKKYMKMIGKDSEYVIVGTSNRSNANKPVRLASINERIETVSQEYNVEDLTPHGLRRHYASYLYAEKEMSIDGIKERMGHSSSIMTERYISSEARTIRQEAEEDETADVGTKLMFDVEGISNVS